MTTQWTAGLRAMRLCVAALCLAGGLTGCVMDDLWSSSSNAPTASADEATHYDVQAAVQQLMITSAKWQLRGQTSDGKAFVTTLSWVPAQSARFALTGQIGRRSVQRMTMQQGSYTVLATARTSYLSDTTSLPYGVEHDDGTCDELTVQTNLPTEAVPGDQGLLSTAVNRSNCTTSADSDGTTVTRWELSQEPERELVQLCLTSVKQNTAGGVIGDESHCFEISPDGQIGPRVRSRYVFPDKVAVQTRNY